MHAQLLSHAQLFVTPRTVAYRAPLSMGFSRQEYRSGLPFPPPGDLPDPGIEPGSPTFQADSLPSEPPGKSLKGNANGGKKKYVLKWTHCRRARSEHSFPFTPQDILVSL